MSDPATLTDDHSYHLDKLVGAGLGRRAMLRAAAVGAVGSAAVLTAPEAAAAGPKRAAGSPVLQPGRGRTRGTYVPARADEVL